ncbi:MAG: AAA family ATPase, partial [Clostridia bacterium]
EKDAIIKQSETIKAIASEDNCVIVGRASDYILRDNPNLVKIFLYASLEYRIKKVQEIYKDDYQNAKKHVMDSDKSRASYYEVISNQSWGKKENYDLCINCEIGNDKIVEIICEYIKNRK